MSEYPKHFAKGDQRRTARHARDEVKFKFEGYRETDAPIIPTGDQPQLPLAELVEKAEAEGVDVRAAVESWETNGGATEQPSNTADQARAARKK